MFSTIEVLWQSKSEGACLNQLIALAVSGRECMVKRVSSAYAFGSA